MFGKLLLSIFGGFVMLSGFMVGFAVLMGIDTSDAVLYNKVQHHVATDVYRAGDVVSISPDGQRSNHICTLDIEDGVLREVVLHKSYRNSINDSLPAFVNFVSWVKDLMVGQQQDGQIERDIEIARVQQVDFRGRLISFPEGEFLPQMNQSCTCAVARKLIARHRVCIVKKALNETNLVYADFTDRSGGVVTKERTIGVSYRSMPLLLDLDELNCPGVSAHASIPKIDNTCDDELERWTATWLRNKLGVIREHNMSVSPTPVMLLQ